MRICICFAICLLSTRALAEPELAGDATRGEAIVLNRDQGHCLLCHQISQVEESFQGNIGPDLSDVGSRLTAAMLRERVIDPTRTNPDSVMPAYHRTDGLNQVAQAYAGKPILDAQAVEDVVAYLKTLKQ